MSDLSPYGESSPEDIARKLSILELKQIIKEKEKDLNVEKCKLELSKLININQIVYIKHKVGFWGKYRRYFLLSELEIEASKRMGGYKLCLTEITENIALIINKKLYKHGLIYNDNDLNYDENLIKVQPSNHRINFIFFR